MYVLTFYIQSIYVFQSAWPRANYMAFGAFCMATCADYKSFKVTKACF